MTDLCVWQWMMKKNNNLEWALNKLKMMFFLLMKMRKTHRHRLETFSLSKINQKRKRKFSQNIVKLFSISFWKCRKLISNWKYFVCEDGAKVSNSLFTRVWASEGYRAQFWILPKGSSIGSLMPSRPANKFHRFCYLRRSNNIV